MMRIKNAANVNLAESTGTLPDVSSGMKNWFRPMKFFKIVKSVVNFKLQEVKTEINFRGVWQVLSPQDLKIMPEGQRNWSYWQVHSETSLELDTDDIIEHEGIKYRVMSKLDNSKYGYFEYHLVQDYQNPPEQA